MIFVYFRQSLVEESLYVRLNNHFVFLLHTWRISYAGVQKGGEERFRVQPDGGRRVGAWQIHLGINNSCCFLFISMIPFIIRWTQCSWLIFTGQKRARRRRMTDRHFRWITIRSYIMEGHLGIALTLHLGGDTPLWAGGERSEAGLDCDRHPRVRRRGRQHQLLGADSWVHRGPVRWLPWGRDQGHQGGGWPNILQFIFSHNILIPRFLTEECMRACTSLHPPVTDWSLLTLSSCAESTRWWRTS